MKRMEPIIITPKTEQEYSLVMAMLKKMRIKAEPMKGKSLERIPGLPYSREEIMDDIRCSEDDIVAGRTTTNDALRKEIATW